ncbi:uncharacterized protein [Nicotiana sylvestris]|uniref:uncharacterized protein n=1 Tax=Nicotiana sylvestris TaxID=4096 RepID=UPI00388C97AC
MADNNRIELVDTGARKQLVEQDTGLADKSPQNEPHAKNEKFTGKEGRDELSRKLKGSKTQKLNLYGGRGDPIAHLRGYCSEMRSIRRKDNLLMAYFSESLTGAALQWYTHQDVNKWHTWDDMAQDFVRNFQYNLNIIPDSSSLYKMEKKPEKSFREFGIRWREQAARVSPSIGKMVEEGIKSGKIMSYSALKHTTEDIQNIPVSLGGRKRNRKDDPLGIPAQRFQPRHRPHRYPCALDDPPQCYFSPHNPQSRTSLSQYPIHNAPPYVPHSRGPRWPAPLSQMSYPPPQAYQPPTRKRFQPRPEYKMKRLLKKEDAFTHIGESYASLFQRLRQLDMLKPIQIKRSNPLPKKFDFSQRCAYCSDALGHNIEKCWHLKGAVQKLINTGDITAQNPNAADTIQSPLPEMHMEDMIRVEKENENYFEILGGPRTAKLSMLTEVDLKSELAKGTQKQFAKDNERKTCEGSSNIDVELSG